MAPLTALLGIEQLKRYKSVQASRAHAYARLSEGLKKLKGTCFEVYEPRPGVKQAIYGIRVKYHPELNGNVPLEELVKRLQAQGVDVHVGTSTPLTEQKIFQEPPPGLPAEKLAEWVGYHKDSLPGVKAYAENRLVFPVLAGPHAEIDYVVKQWLRLIEKELTPAGS